MRLKLIAAALLFSSGASAQIFTERVSPETVYVQPVEPSEDIKKAALLKAYELAGNTMDRWGGVDVTEYVKELQQPKPVKTDRLKMKMVHVEPKAAPAVKSTDVCTRHGMRKSIRGKSWRCVR